MCTVSDYVEHYYIPIMKLDKKAPAVSEFIKAVSEFNVDTFLPAYNELQNYIRHSVNDHTLVNMYFNRMRSQLQTAHSLNLPIVNF